MKTKLQLKHAVLILAVMLLPALTWAQSNNPLYSLPEGGFYSDDETLFECMVEQEEPPIYYVVPAFSSVTFKNLIPENDYLWDYYDWWYQDEMGSENSSIEDNGDFTILSVAPTDISAIYNGFVPGSPFPELNDFVCRGRVGSYPGDLCLSPTTDYQPIKVGGLSSGYALGTGDGSDGFVQVVTKPASTLYVENISAKVVSKTQPLADGATLTMEVCHVGQDDVVGAPFITLKATAADQSLEGQDGDMSVYNLVFRTTDGQPFVIDERFAVKVMGCSEPGVDVGFQVQQKPDEYVCPLVKPLMVDGSTTDISGFETDMVAYINFDNAIFDHVSVRSNYDGTDVCHTFPSGSTTLVWLTTAEYYDWDTGSERYPIINKPDWITYDIDHSQAQWQSFYLNEWVPWGTSQLAMDFAPLPDGVAGRYCKLYFKGKGVISNPLTIIQGDVTVPDAGDVNYDAVVDVEDVNAVINLILNEAKLMDNPDADVNHDGNIDIADVNALINIILAQ